MHFTGTKCFALDSVVVCLNAKIVALLKLMPGVGYFTYF